MEAREINIQSFYPKELEVRGIEETEKQIYIHLKSKNTSCECPRCHKMVTKKRATYERKVQNLPILGKTVWLIVNIYEYQCQECNKPIAESFGDFIKPISRMTERCSEFIIRLALGASCEGASKIIEAMGITYSGDSICRLLLKRLEPCLQQK